MPVASCLERSSRAQSSPVTASNTSGAARKNASSASRGSTSSVELSAASQSCVRGESGASTASAINSPLRNTSTEISRPLAARQTERIRPRTTRMAASRRVPWAPIAVPRPIGRIVACRASARSASERCAPEHPAGLEGVEGRAVSCRFDVAVVRVEVDRCGRDGHVCLLSEVTNRNRGANSKTARSRRISHPTGGHP